MRRPQKIGLIFHLICCLLSKCQIKWEILQIFVAFSEKLNFKVHIFWEGHKISTVDLTDTKGQIISEQIVVF